MKHSDGKRNQRGSLAPDHNSSFATHALMVVIQHSRHSDSFGN